MKDTKFLMVLAVALMLDAVDYTVGWIPVAGDVIDVFGVIVMLFLIGKYALLGIAELVPFLDFLPLFTAGVIAWKMGGGKKVE